MRPKGKQVPRPEAGGRKQPNDYLWSTLYMCLMSSSTLLE